MKQFLRYVVLVLSLGEAIGWPIFVWNIHDPWAGLGDGGPSYSPPNPDHLLIFIFFCGPIWLFFISAYFYLLRMLFKPYRARHHVREFQYSTRMLLVAGFAQGLFGLLSPYFRWMILGNIVIWGICDYLLRKDLVSLDDFLNG